MQWFDGDGHSHEAYVRDEIGRALAHLRQAGSILDRLAADEATRLQRDNACYRLGEASHAIHLARAVIAECVEEPAGSKSV